MPTMAPTMCLEPFQVCQDSQYKDPAQTGLRAWRGQTGNTPPLLACLRQRRKRLPTKSHTLRLTAHEKPDFISLLNQAGRSLGFLS